MKLKSELYQKEQNDILDKIIETLNLDENNQITLYSLDNDVSKQNKIMSLIPDIRKYYSFRDIKGASEPNKIDRPWLSIIKQITKNKYNILRKDHRIYRDNKPEVRTIIYTFVKI